ncbi:MAG: DUF4332 domain-containing protein [Chloroflexota bacterium]
MPPTENLQRVPELLLERLERQGIFTTGLFLEVSETPTRRIYLADQIGVTTNEINEWRDEALLLNLANFGSTEQRIFTQAGIVGLKGLLADEPSVFHERIGAAAYTLDIEAPSDLTIEGWYQQAQTLEGQ